MHVYSVLLLDSTWSQCGCMSTKVQGVCILGECVKNSCARGECVCMYINVQGVCVGYVQVCTILHCTCTLLVHLTHCPCTHCMHPPCAFVHTTLPLYNHKPCTHIRYTDTPSLHTLPWYAHTLNTHLRIFPHYILHLK